MTLLLVCAGVVVVLAIALVVVLPTRFGTVQAREIDRAWRAAADELDGEIAPGDISGRKLIATVDGSRVVVDHYERGTVEGLSETFTRAVVKSTAPPDFRLRVDAAHLLSGLARAVGFQDVPVGEEAFDDDFIIKSNDPEAAKLVLNSRVRAAIRAAEGYASGSWDFELKNRKVTAISSGLKVLPGEIVAVARATAALADGRQRVLSQWKKVARAHGGAVEPRAGGWATMDLDLDGMAVVVDTRKIRDDHFTFARARVRGGTLEPFVLARERHAYQSRLPKAWLDRTPSGYELWTSDPQRVSAQLDDETLAVIERMRPAKVRGEEHHVIVTWDGITTSLEQLERGIEAAVSIAGCLTRASA
jgi:hypothetical protein